MTWSAVRWLGAYLGWLLFLYVFLWNAYLPTAMATEQANTAAALSQVAALQTQVALRPLPTAKPCYQTVSYGC